MLACLNSQISARLHSGMRACMNLPACLPSFLPALHENTFKLAAATSEGANTRASHTQAFATT
eukprot:92573-Alexandrium_andersonii.AAC.1